jgi:hypothetical protein
MPASSQSFVHPGSQATTFVTQDDGRLPCNSVLL